MLDDVRDPLLMEPGGGRPKKKRVDSEYERKGTYHVLMAFEPLRGWREVRVSKHRRKQEFALVMRKLAEDVYPDEIMPRKSA